VLAVAHVGGGGDFRRDILYLAIYGLYTFIWDVLACEGEREGAKSARECIPEVRVPN
jgi:hypothetical protein